MNKDITYLHIKRALETAKECFLCTFEDELERKYVNTYLHELVMDASSRQKIIESRGFCNHHSYKMLIEASKPESSDGHGMALVMKSVIEQLIQDIHKQSKKIKEPAKIEREVSQILSNDERCPACIRIDEFILMYIKEFLEILSKDDYTFLKLFSESMGFCLPHYATVLDVALNRSSLFSKVVKLIVNVEETNLRKIDEQLAEYIRRQDYRSKEKPDEEVIFGAVSKLVGRRGARPILLHKDYLI